MSPFERQGRKLALLLKSVTGPGEQIVQSQPNCIAGLLF
jgi:hypothetical protein